MTIPVGRAQSKHKLNFLRARRTGFYHRVGTSCPTWLRPFALPHPDKPCNYHQRGALPASTCDSGVGLTQLFNHYFEEEKNDGAKDHHDHRGARASAKMCRVGLATLWFATLLGICGLLLVRHMLGDAPLEPHEK